MTLLGVPIFIIMAFGLSFLVIGSVYVNHCKLEPMVPIWLIIMGKYQFIFASTVVVDKVVLYYIHRLRTILFSL